MKLNRRTTKPARIEMLPLMDIVFLLLVFFIYAMLSMTVHRGMQLELPDSSRAVTSEKQALAVSVRNGPSGVELFLDRDPVTLHDLPALLNNRLADDRLPVQVFAEKTISYQQLYQVLDRIKESRVTEISLQASPR